jgi:hypothetical protein
MFARVSNSSNTEVEVGSFKDSTNFSTLEKQCDELGFTNLFFMILLVTSVKS